MMKTRLKLLSEQEKELFSWISADFQLIFKSLLADFLLIKLTFSWFLNLEDMIIHQLCLFETIKSHKTWIMKYEIY